MNARKMSKDEMVKKVGHTRYILFQLDNGQIGTWARLVADNPNIIITFDDPKIQKLSQK